MSDLTELERDIITCLGIVGITDIDDLSDILGVSERVAQEALHKLDDEGYVLMRNGWYRLSEAYKAGKL
jgi:Mn-dependent DtxR family transcriptional regulator